MASSIGLAQCPGFLRALPRAPGVKRMFAAHGHGASAAGCTDSYRPRSPEKSLLYTVMAANLETFLARQQQRGRHVPLFVERELRALGSAAIYDEQPRQVRSSKAFGKSSFA